MTLETLSQLSPTLKSGMAKGPLGGWQLGRGSPACASAWLAAGPACSLTTDTSKDPGCRTHPPHGSAPLTLPHPSLHLPSQTCLERDLQWRIQETRQLRPPAAMTVWGLG